MRTKGEIYASVLHDINSPLTVISGFVDMINRSLSDASTVEGEKLETIRATEQADRPGGRCFEISRRYFPFCGTGNQGGSDGARVGLNQVLTDLKELLVRHPSSRGNHSRSICCRRSGWRRSTARLLQILLNLTINALTCTDKPHR